LITTFNNNLCDAVQRSPDALWRDLTMRNQRLFHDIVSESTRPALMRFALRNNTERYGKVFDFCSRKKQ
jgi:hypothetical protein